MKKGSDFELNPSGNTGLEQGVFQSGLNYIYLDTFYSVWLFLFKHFPLGCNAKSARSYTWTTLGHWVGHTILLSNHYKIITQSSG